MAAQRRPRSTAPTRARYGAVADDDVLAVVVMRIWPLLSPTRCARLDRCLTPPIRYAGDPVFDLHVGGKMEVRSTVGLESRDDLSLAYTPGVARVCEAIAEDPALTRHYTWVPNTVAVVTDGTAVLGLGDIGPAAAMPVMEGKAVLFKAFGGVDAVPICLDTTDVEEIIETVVRLAPSFGGINLEDISAPRCFEIEDRLKERLDIPVFHDDQHGTAVVALAALTNALKLTGRDPESTRVVISGCRGGRCRGRQDPARGGHQGPRRDRPQGRAALLARRPHPGEAGAGGADRRPDRTQRHAGRRAGRRRRLHRRLRRAPCPRSRWPAMAPESIIFGLANPNPEVHPDVAHKYARIVATGRSDFPNQINNVLAFPGHLPGRLRRPRDRDHRGDEARRRAWRWPSWSATTWPRSSSSPRRSTRGSGRRSRPRWPRRRAATGWLAPARLALRGKR